MAYQFISDRETRTNFNHFHRHPSISDVETASFWISRLSMTSCLEAHNGCVNTLNYNEDGSLLISGSDDLHLNIWDFHERTKKASIFTGHTANIFCAKFIPHTSDTQLLSCAGDGNIFLTDLNRVIEAAPSNIENNGNEFRRRSRYGTTYNSKLFEFHTDTAHKLTIDPENYDIFLSCGSDGTVRQFDLREPVPRDGEKTVVVDLRKIPYVAHAPPSPSAVLFGRSRRSCAIAVNALSLNPLDSSSLVIGCDDPFVRMYDRRMLRPSSQQFQCVKRLCPPELAEKKAHVTGVQHSIAGDAVVATYSGHGLFLFDVKSHHPSIDSTEARGVLRSQQKSTKYEHKHTDAAEKEEAETPKESEGEGREEEASTEPGSVVPIDLQKEYESAEKHDAVQGKVQQAAEAAEEEEEEEVEEENEDNSEYGMESDDEDQQDKDSGKLGPRDEPALNASSEGELVLGYVRKYADHVSVRTVKEVSFMGPRSEMVLTGSDCGHAFVYERSTGRVLAALKGDEDVVNCIQPHPSFQPILATSGIESTIKIWEPDTEMDATSNEPRIEELIRQNHAGGAPRRPVGLYLPPTFLIDILQGRQAGGPGSATITIPLEMLLQSVGARRQRSSQSAEEGSQSEATEEGEEENSDDEGGAPCAMQ